MADKWAGSGQVNRTSGQAVDMWTGRGQVDRRKTSGYAAFGADGQTKRMNFRQKMKYRLRSG